MNALLGVVSQKNEWKMARVARAIFYLSPVAYLEEEISLKNTIVPRYPVKQSSIFRSCIDLHKLQSLCNRFYWHMFLYVMSFIRHLFQKWLLVIEMSFQWPLLVTKFEVACHSMKIADEISLVTKRDI